jgi:hypothetical protein
MKLFSTKDTKDTKISNYFFVSLVLLVDKKGQGDE